MKKQNELFPIFLKANKLNILIVGGGNVAYEKLHFLLKSSPKAKVKLVASIYNQNILTLAEKYTNIKIYRKTFTNSDLKDIDIAILATNDIAVNQVISYQAKKQGILVNVADTPKQSDFYMGSIVTKGDLKIAISTNGQSPTFAKRFRQLLESALPEDIDDLLNNLNVIRNSLKGDFSLKVKKLNTLTESLI